MHTQIFAIKKGINTIYIIKEKSCIMIDGGPPGMQGKFLKKLKEYSIDPKEIKLIILSHADFDHAGSSNEIRNITGAKILIHEKDAKGLQNAELNWPKGVNTWGKISRTILKPFLNKAISFSPIKPDIILKAKVMALEEYGISGKIIHTPGHTPGSLSVLLDSGELFAGCLSHNLFPLTVRPKLPIYADDIEMVKKSWKEVIELGARIAYPGHGNAFPVERIKNYL